MLFWAAFCQSCLTFSFFWLRKTKSINILFNCFLHYPRLTTWGSYVSTFVPKIVWKKSLEHRTVPYTITFLRHVDLPQSNTSGLHCFLLFWLFTFNFKVTLPAVLKNNLRLAISWFTLIVKWNLNLKNSDGNLHFERLGLALRVKYNAIRTIKKVVLSSLGWHK